MAGTLKTASNPFPYIKLWTMSNLKTEHGKVPHLSKFKIGVSRVTINHKEIIIRVLFAITIVQ